MRQVGWFERLFDGDGGEFRGRSVQEGAAGRGQPDALDFFHASAAQALVDGVVFAVDGQQRLALRRASAVISSPAATRHSLFARPTVFPARTAS